MPGAHDQRGAILERGFLDQIIEHRRVAQRAEHQIDLAIAQRPTSSAWLPSTTATSTPGWAR
jgi:Zn-finger nucleic acid-binding protein